MEPITPNPQLIAETQANNRLLSDTVSSVGRFGLAAAGIGASTRLLQEVLAANRATKQRKNLNLVSIPAGMKMAQAAVPAPAPALPGSAVADLNPLGRPLYRDPLNPGEQYRALGHRASNFLEVPWAIPAAGAAVAVGGLGAYSLLDNLLNARRKKDLKDEVDDAKGEFESALSGNVPGQMKTASLQELSNRYAAAVSDKPVKKASDWLGAGQGIYAGGLLAALGIGGMYGWQQAAKSDPTRVRAELARRRAARRLATEPVEVELAPTQMPTKMAGENEAGTARPATFAPGESPVQIISKSKAGYDPDAAKIEKLYQTGLNRPEAAELKPTDNEDAGTARSVSFDESLLARRPRILVPQLGYQGPTWPGPLADTRLTGTSKPLAGWDVTNRLLPPFDRLGGTNDPYIFDLLRKKPAVNPDSGSIAR